MKVWNAKKNLPAKIEAIAAIRNDKTTEGPECSLATCPATTYMPAPNVLPIPIINNKVVRHAVLININ